MMPSSPQLLILFITVVLVIALPLVLFGPIAKRAGFSNWWSLLMMIPIFNIGVIWMFAFMQWPAEKKQ